MHHDLVHNRKAVREAALAPLHVLRRRSGNPNFDLLRTEPGMFCERRIVAGHLLQDV
jgi:hypothetical protein